IVDVKTQRALSGVTVSDTKKQVSAKSQGDGTFTLQLNDGQRELLFSLLGYELRQVTLNENQTTVHVELSSKQEVLNEVVVVGYGTQRKIETTGAIASVKAEEL